MPNLNIIPWHTLRADNRIDIQGVIVNWINAKIEPMSTILSTTCLWFKQQLDERDDYIRKLESDLGEIKEYQAQIYEVIPGGQPADIELLQGKVEDLENKLEEREEQLREIARVVKEHGI